MSNFNQTYKDAGVDVEAGYKSVELMKKSVEATFTKAVLNGLGGFGGMVKLDLKGIENPVLVSGTDGVGTKLKVAFLTDKHDTIGIDCVAMCVNDIVCCGAKPLLFLDYIACDKNYPEKIADIVRGVAEGCLQAGCSLVGGETAEMPGFYSEGEYDLAGFSTGVVDENKVLNNENVNEGDVLIALPSSGVHSNGFSLVRKVFNINSESFNDIYVEELKDTVLNTLLTPTKIYVKPALAVLEEINVKSIAHITGGGFYENIPRALPKDKSVSINKKDVRVLPIFDLIQKTADIPDDNMYSTFNMGVGMVMIVSKEDAEKTIAILKENGEDAYILGNVVKGNGEVILC